MPGAVPVPAPASEPAPGPAPGSSILARIRTIPARRWKLLLAVILLLALSLRLTTLISLRESLYADFLWWDERTYDRWARHLVAGAPYHVHSLSPLPAYALAAVYRVLGAEPLWVRLLNVALGVATCGWLFAIGRRLGGTGAGLAAALAGAVYGPFVLFSVTLLKEPLGLVLFGGLVWLVLAEHGAHRPWRALALGAVAGLLVNVRQNAGVVLAVALPWILWELRRGSRSWRAPARVLLLATAGFAAATAPFAVANLRGAGRLSPVPLGGFDLYRGNAPDGPTPYWNPVPFASTHPDTQGIEFTVEASRRAGRPLTQAEASSYWAGEVARLAWTRPAPFGRRLLAKAHAAVHAWEEGDDQSLPFLADHVRSLRAPLLGWTIAFPLGVAGLVLLALRRRRGAALLAAAALAYGATLVLVFSNMRIRAPLVLVLLPCATAGLAELFAAVRTRRSHAAAWAVTALAGFAVELAPLRGAGDLSAHRNTHALVLLTQGRRDEALAWWRRSSDEGGAYACIADLALAAAAHEDGDRTAARGRLARVPDASHAAAQRDALEGTLLAAEGRREEAARAFEASLARNASQLGTMRQALEVYAMLGDDARVRAREAQLADLLRRYGPLAGPGAPATPAR